VRHYITGKECTQVEMVGLVLDPGVRFRDLLDRGQQHRIPWTTLSNRKARAFAPPAGSVRSKRIALPKHLIIGYDTPGSGAGRGGAGQRSRVSTRASCTRHGHLPRDEASVEAPQGHAR
jgi:hypothetical protein